MQTIEFTIKGTAPIMFSKENLPFEEEVGKGNGRTNKNETPMEQAAKCLHTINGNGKGSLAAIPAHSLLKGMQAVTTIALGRSTRKSWVKLVKGGIKIEPAFLPVDPQNWTLDVRRAGTSNKGPGTGAKLYRPRFDDWSASGTIVYDDEHLSAQDVRSLLDTNGRFNGLGSYRVGVGGPFGSFIVTKWEDDS